MSERIDPEDLRETFSRLLERKPDAEVFKTEVVKVISRTEANTLMGSVRILVNTHSTSQSPEVEHRSEDVEEQKVAEAEEEVSVRQSSEDGERTDSPLPSPIEEIEQPTWGTPADIQRGLEDATLSVDRPPLDIQLLCISEPQVSIDDENHKMFPATGSSAEQDTRPHTGPLGMTHDTYALDNHKSQTQTLPQQVANSSPPTSQKNGAPPSALSDNDSHTSMKPVISSSGQKSVKMSELLRVGEAVCRIIEGKQCFFLLTCCHIFLKEGERRQEIEDLKVPLLRCKEARFEVWVKESLHLLTAKEVLEDCENPNICFDQKYDLLAVKVKDPTTFGAKTFKFHTWPWGLRKNLLKKTEQFCIVHIPTDKEDKPEGLHVTFGPKYTRNTGDNDQDKELRYILDTRPGSSGSPLLYYTDGSLKCLILVGVHLRRARNCEEHPYRVAAVLTQDFFEKMKNL